MPSVKSPPRRLTREERRAETRERLLDAAADVFAERGFHGASVEEIAERAGFTRGAFYSNFGDKDDVFLAVYDKRLEGQVDQISAVMQESSAPGEFFSRLRETRAGTNEPEWLLLHSEFQMYALRNPEVRPKFAERYRRERRLYARAIEEVFGGIGLGLPAPVEDLAVILQLLDAGIQPLRQMDPGSIREGFFFDALALLFEAAVALSEKREATA